MRRSRPARGELSCVLAPNRDIPVGSSVHGEVDPLLRTYIKSHMVMVGAQLPEIAAQANGYIERVAEISFGIVYLGEYLAV